MVARSTSESTRNHLDELQDAIKYASPFLEITPEEEELDFTYYYPWERAMFQLARGVLGIDHYRKALYRMWQDETEPTPNEQSVIADIIQRWLKAHLGNDLQKVKAGLLEESGLEAVPYARMHDFLKRRLWKVTTPIKRGERFQIAYQSAVAEFLACKPSRPARDVIVDHDIMAPHCRFMVILFFKFHDSAEDGIFQISQKKVSESINALIEQHPNLFTTNLTDRSTVARFIALLKHEGILEQVDSAVQGRTSSKYRFASKSETKAKQTTTKELEHKGSVSTKGARA